MKKKRHTVIGEGIKCPRCDAQTETRVHDILREKQLKAPYYFSQWDYCTGCNYIQLYEKYKVLNNGQAYSEYKKRKQEWEEHNDQISFIKSI